MDRTAGLGCAEVMHVVRCAVVLGHFLSNPLAFLNEPGLLLLGRVGQLAAQLAADTDFAVFGISAPLECKEGLGPLRPMD